MTNLDLRVHLRRTHQTALYPFAGLAHVQGLMYVALGLAGEAGEIANQIKKVARDDSGMVTGERRVKILDELGDVMWYWMRLCHELNIDPYEALEHNAVKLASRAATGTLRGDRRETTDE
jgi:NTP pyrophosphatase (non-canonical NTP hydrolase)